MSNKTIDTKNKILNVAFDLFTKNGYDNTTIEEIISTSQCSKATFYHYFSSKSSLLNAGSPKLEELYENWYKNLDPNMNAIDKLKNLNNLVLDYTEFYVDISIICALYSAQITNKNERLLTSTYNMYISMVQEIIKDGQIKNEIKKDSSFIELTKMYLSLQRGVIYEWCYCFGSYSLKEFGVKMMDMFIVSYTYSE